MSRFILGKESDGDLFLIDIEDMNIYRADVSTGGTKKKGYFYYVKLYHSYMENNEKQFKERYLYYCETREEAHEKLLELLNVLNEK